MPHAYPHLAARLFNTPLLLHPGKLSAIVAGLAGRFDLTAAPSAYLAPAGTQERGGYLLTAAGVAVIDVFGALVHRSSMKADSTFLQGYDGIARYLTEALADPAVKAILLQIDSPGGEVAGAFQLAEQIYAARKCKPIAAIASDCAASAAYLLASAADTLSVTRTGMVGSIGIVTCHADLSRALDKEGIAITCIYAGAHKADGNPYQPLPPAVAAQIQADVDHYYQLFLTTVASYRPQTSVDVLKATEAKTYIGPQAVFAQLADFVETPDQALTRLTARVSTSTGSRMASKVLHMSDDLRDTDTPIPAPVPTPEPAPAARHLDAVTIVRLSNAAGEPRLAEILVATPHTAEQVQARLVQASAVRKICAIAQTPDLADDLIAAGADQDAAMLATWHALADRSAAHPVDNTPPLQPGGNLTRAAFEALTPAQRADALRAGRRIVD